ncbi:MAG: heme-binding domain-containing protein [Flavobacteriales bacterium]|nr:heme-binding domain-containing protein [Flavobacteriales bacterium]
MPQKESGPSPEFPEQMIKRILLVLFVLILVAQLVQPDRSVPAVDPTQDLVTMTAAPPDIQAMMIGACYDCHSNRTTYPWYARLTPVNFIMQDHIKEGREVLNFSTWPAYANTEEAHECVETMQEGEMPPAYYRFMHAHGDLLPAQQEQLIAWFNTSVGAQKRRGRGGGGGARVVPLPQRLPQADARSCDERDPVAFVMLSGR